jgi:ribosome recycling factor
MFDEFKKRLEKSLEVVAEELKLIRTGRAKPSMLEHIRVEAYGGQQMQLNELATISAPDSQLLIVSPWDKSVVGQIEKAIRISNLNLNPVVDGDIIRIVVPQLTQERREEMVKLVKQKMESGKNMLRDSRTRMKKELDDMEDDAGVSEDDIKSWMEDMQKLFEQYQQKLEAMGESKEKELMEL